MFRKYRRFAKRYWQFSVATAASAIGLIFQFTGPVAITHWLLGLVALALTIKLIINMWRSLRDGSYGIDLLAATAIITAVILHEYWVGIVIVLMLTGGEALEDYAENRAQVELKSLLSHAPHRAHVIRRGKSVDLPIAEVRIGDKVIIKPGEVVPVDAIILEGMSSFNESSITGESLPELKQVGADILSGSVNLDGIITAKALRAAADSQYEQIIKLVRSASHSKAPFVRMADRYAIPFTIIAFAIAGGIWLWSGEAIRFLEVLVVATPCPLILAAPIAIISGMSRASKAGIIVKNGGALERLAKIKSIAFDKTGTLTHGELKVTGVKTFGKFTTAEVMGYAASAEKGSTHALSSAIIQHAEQLKTKTFKVKSLRESSGLGIIAYTNAQTVLVGRADLLSENGIEVPKSVIESNVIGTRTFVALNNQLAGIISFEDALRSDSKSTIDQMRRNHVKDIYLITGDNLASAKNVAKQVGIDIKRVIANALPVDKLKAVENNLEPPVAFVGDGVNDAPVLVAADVGIAMGAKGSTAASQSADIVIMPDKLSKVADAHLIAKRTFSIARQSIQVGIGLSVGLMLIFATGKFQPIYGAVVQEFVDVAVIFNALRAHSPGRSSGKSTK